MRISATSRSSSVWDTLGVHPRRVDDAGNRDDLVPAHNQRPRLAGRTGDLRVDEHVLNFLRSPSEPVAGAPGSYLKAWQLRGDPPLAPAHLALERYRGALEPDVVVFPHRGQPTAEVQPLRTGCRGEQLAESGRLALRKPQQVALRTWMELAQPR